MKSEWWILVVALIAGAFLRLPSLGLRSMHTDEAVHAVKFGTLLETGTYRYDKNEYHGPTLNYLTLLPAWISSEKKLADVTETTLRIVPVFFGFCLVVLLVLVGDIDRKSLSFAALLTACSPAMVYYSRYYIQEMLLVCFAFGLIVAGYRLIMSGRTFWAILAGACAGLMHATKETSLISFGAMGLAVLGVLLLRRHEGRPGLPVSVGNLAVALFSGVAVSVMFFSSFFTHWQGVADSVLAYQIYFGRAGQSALHGHPWYYYLQLLTWSKGDHGPVWTESAITAFGLLGIWSALREKAGSEHGGRDLRIFLGLYAILMFVISSTIPYKTPWSILSALQPLIIMAGCGLATFLTWLGARRLRSVGILVTTVLVGHLTWQAYLANFTYYDDPVNPYVYSHPTNDVRLVAGIVRDVVQASPEGLAMPVQVVCPGDDYWPLPWYLRSLPNVGWWNAAGENFVPTRLILSSPEVEAVLLVKLYERPSPGNRPLYVPLFDRTMSLRPGKEIRGYVTLDLWEKARKDPVR
jgi:uncharacterized protein (TIGR03663 family)